MNWDQFGIALMDHKKQQAQSAARPARIGRKPVVAPLRSASSDDPLSKPLESAYYHKGYKARRDGKAWTDIPKYGRGSQRRTDWQDGYRACAVDYAPAN